MANGAAKPHIAEFQVLEALYQEAELMRPVTISSRPITKRPPQTQPAIAPTESAPSDAMALSDDLPVMVRISDLYEEAEAERIMADEARAQTTNTEETARSEETTSTEETPDLSDEFAIPAAFDAPSTVPEQEIVPLDDEVTSEDNVLIAALTNERDGDIDMATSDTSDAMANDLPAALPDISDMPAAPHEAALADTTDEDAMIAALAEDMAAPSLDTSSPAASEVAEEEISVAMAAAADAHSDADESDLADNNEDDVTAIETAPSPEAQPVDDDISKQLDDVRQAVEAASAIMSGTEDSDAQEHTSEDDSEAIRLPEEVAAADDHEAHDQETHGEEAPLVAGPKLAAFIGETVRDVLEDELPSLVRGLVDEALSERHGRYGGSAPIGLRTKSTRH